MLRGLLLKGSPLDRGKKMSNALRFSRKLDLTDQRCSMARILGRALCICFLYVSVHAADKIRIGFPDLAAPFIPLAIGDKRGFFQEEGLQGEFIRINPAIAFQALVGARSTTIRYLALESPRGFEVSR